MRVFRSCFYKRIAPFRPQDGGDPRREYERTALSPYRGSSIRRRPCTAFKSPLERRSFTLVLVCRELWNTTLSTLIEGSFSPVRTSLNRLFRCSVIIGRLFAWQRFPPEFIPVFDSLLLSLAAFAYEKGSSLRAGCMGLFDTFAAYARGAKEGFRPEKPL